MRRRHLDLGGARVQVVEQAAEVAGKVGVEALAAHLEKYTEPDQDGLVFTTPRGA